MFQSNVDRLISATQQQYQQQQQKLTVYIISEKYINIVRSVIDQSRW